jgi:2-polyprenyl-6-methoxyphenol hydroxylase-like FAD-dependent oxidoreductase
MFFMKILIIGGGIGGLTTALACHHAKLDYEVFEAAPVIKEVGAGIWVPPNAMKIMQRLGMSDAILKTGKSLEEISVGGPNGDVWYTIHAEKIRAKFDFSTTAIHRARLQALLYNALDKQSVHTGKRFKSFVDEKGKVGVLFDDGTQATGDCLVGADGLRSATRKQLFGNLPLRYSGQTCWRGIVNHKLPDYLGKSMFELWGKLSGQRFAYSQINEEEVYYYATLATPAGGTDNAATTKTFLHTCFDSFGPLVNSIIQSIDPSNIIRTDLFDLKPIHTWTKQNVALLGDAAHATTPNLGQGAAQAIEDAYTLVAELKTQQRDIPAALKAYQDRRIKKAHYIVNTSWRFGQITNIGNPVGVALRNWFIRSAPASFANRQLEKVYRVDLAKELVS